jgi:hypothetical protein
LADASFPLHIIFPFGRSWTSDLLTLLATRSFPSMSLFAVFLACSVVVVTGSDTLSSGGSLRNGQTLVSPNGRARFVVQPDGNMVVYRLDNKVLWKSDTSGDGSRLDMQENGNLVWYDGNSQAGWKSDTNTGNHLVMQDDCNLVLYDSKGGSPWASASTCGSTSTPTAAPTDAPTHMPALHPCDDGNHGCDTSSTQCEKTESSSNGHGQDIASSYSCACLEGFVVDLAAPGHDSCMATANPTLEPTAEPTTEPTPSLQRPQSAADITHAGDLHHITASTLHVKDGGFGHSVGDITSIGEGLPGWVTPAIMSVTGVDGNGAITSNEVVNGGEFSNDVLEERARRVYSLVVRRFLGSVRRAGRSEAICCSIGNCACRGQAVPQALIQNYLSVLWPVLLAGIGGATAHRVPVRLPLSPVSRLAKLFSFIRIASHRDPQVIFLHPHHLPPRSAEPCIHACVSPTAHGCSQCNRNNEKVPHWILRMRRHQQPSCVWCKSIGQC